MDFTLELTPYDWLLIAILALNLHWILAVRLSRIQSLGGSTLETGGQ